MSINVKELDPDLLGAAPGGADSTEAAEPEAAASTAESAAPAAGAATRIALIGNPNSGKTTVYNALTGKNERVGNWAGVTVDSREAPVKKSFVPEGQEAPTLVDLPGAYSMTAFTSEESITTDFVTSSNPSVIVNVVDATNLSRGLFLTTQLLELGVPVVVALNKHDLAQKKDVSIDVDVLSAKLGCRVVATSATSASTLKPLVQTALAQAGAQQDAPFSPSASAQEAAEDGKPSAADKERYAFVDGVVAVVEKRAVQTAARGKGDAVDDVLTNPWVGIPLFAVVMYLVFQISQAEGPLGIGKILEGILSGYVDTFGEYVAGLLEGASPVMQAIVVDGVIGGVSAVMGFLPLVMVMYFLLALLEDCGYLARVAVVLDPVFKRVGLSGRSIIPFVITTGCAVPGIMASRTIRNEHERRATAMLSSFMPCGAKIPVIALFAGAFFDDAGWVSTLMYFCGIAMIFLGALLINAVTAYKPKNSYFILELPEYKVPSLVGAFKSMCSRGWAFIVKAATIILLCNMAVQLMQTFTWSFEVAENADQSILASLASPFAYLLVPVVGVCSWQLAAAAITGFIAKENVVGTLAVCFVGLENLIDTEELAMLEGTGADVAGIMAITKIAALAYLMFVLYTPPCFAAMGAMNSELQSGKWLAGGICMQLGVGYTVGYVVYTVGTLVTGGTLNVAAALGGLVAVACFAGIAVALGKSARKKQAAESGASAAA